jgi:hypothetical protein
MAGRKGIFDLREGRFDSTFIFYRKEWAARPFEHGEHRRNGRRKHCGLATFPHIMTSTRRAAQVQSTPITMRNKTLIRASREHSAHMVLPSAHKSASFQSANFR